MDLIGSVPEFTYLLLCSVFFTGSFIFFSFFFLVFAHFVHALRPFFGLIWPYEETLLT